MKNLIVIPARFGSTRFPGKPLYNIAGQSLLQHVCNIALLAANSIPDTEVLVATDDQRILEHAKEINVSAILTDAECATGTDRVIAAIQQLEQKPNLIINLQGDAPLTPSNILIELILALQQSSVVTPVMQLRWSELDILRAAKQLHPFSGTTAILDKNYEAVWFSKQIIPAIRNEKNLRITQELSPIYQHLGIYAYTYEALMAFSSLPASNYEVLEGLEQLRFIENGYKVKTLPIKLANLDAWRGVDTKEDALFVENLLAKGFTKI